MPPRLQQITDRINSLNLRERGLLMLAIIVIIVGIWEAALFGPLQDQHDTLQRQITALRTSVTAMNQTITQAARKSAENPNTALRKQLASVQKTNQTLNDKLSAITAGLIGPREMATVLERVLKAQHGLKLISMANQPAKPITLGAKGSSHTIKVFQHGLTLTFKGSYLNTLGYLTALSKLPWHFYWDTLDLETEHYPTNKVTIKVHTLSLEEGWLGV